METAKYLCEFFFTNFWHFTGLVCVCWALSPKINNNCPTNIGWKSKFWDNDE